MQVAILLASVMNEECLKSTVAALQTVDGNRGTWDTVCSHLLEEYHSHQTGKSSNISADIPVRAATVNCKENQYRIRCYNCNKLGRAARNCNADKKDKSGDKGSTISIAKVSGGDYQSGFIRDSGATQHILKDISPLPFAQRD